MHCLITKKLHLIVLMMILMIAGLVNAESFENEEGESLVHLGINVDLNKPMSADVTAFGAHVFLDNKVGGDFSAMGEDIAIHSPIEGDLDVIGGKVVLSSEIKGDAQIFASKILFKEGSLIVGKSHILARKVSLKGRIEGDVLIRARKVYIDGMINGTSMIDSPKIILGKHAVLKGKMIYPRGSSLKISEEAKLLGGQEFFEKNRLEGQEEIFEGDIFEGIPSTQIYNFMHSFLHKGFNEHWSFNMGWGSFFIIVLLWIVAFIVISLFYRATPRILQDITQEALENPGRSLGIGLIGFVLIPFLCILMCITVIGIPVALIIGLFYFVLLFLGKILGVWFFAQWVLRLTPFKEKPSCGRDFLAFIVSLPIVSCLSLIPLLGWLFAVLIFLMGFGALLSHMFLPRGTQFIYNSSRFDVEKYKN